MIPASFRIYFILKFAYELSPINSFRGKFYQILFNVQYPLVFSIKSYMSMRPFASVALLYILGLLVSGFNLRVFEKSIPGKNYYSVWDQIYLIASTQTTFGYGEIIPKTHIGRAICVFSCIYGLFLFSYMVLSVTNIIELDEKEKKFYDIVVYDYSKTNILSSIALILIQRW